MIRQTKTILMTCLLIMILMSCDKMKKPADQIQDQTIKAVETEASPQVEEPEEVIPAVPLGFLVTYKDKYAAQEKLFEREELADRLKNLERFNYEALLKNYNTETSIVIADGIVHMSGCRAHDCPSSAYDFFIDLENDNINIYHFRGNMLRIYHEKGWIELPMAFADEMETKKANAKIGSTDDIESEYTLE